MGMVLEFSILIMFKSLILKKENLYKDKFNRKLLIKLNISSALISKANMDKLLDKIF